MHLSVRNVTKRFGNVVALDHVDIDVRDGEFVCLLGPSGCGKTTLLRIVAGLEEASEGTVTLDGADLTDLPARQRGFGIVFQSYSLFPNLTAAENIAYGLTLRRVPKAQAQERVRELLDTVGLPGIGDRLPHQLSGGQQQRVAVARALAVEPKLLLLDEPLSALDAKVRLTLRDQIRDLQRRLNLPTLMVTHDQEEALAVSDRVICMNHGRIEQADTPEGLYLRPTTRFVAEFVGHMNFLGPQDIARIGTLRGPGGPVSPTGIAGIRPEHVVVLPAGSPPGENTVAGRVVSRQFLGATMRIEADVNGVTVVVDAPGLSAVAEGEAVTLALPAERLREFPA
ncbi:ABC transporter ATP-binding protein [Alsobacter sp. R-9]